MKCISGLITLVLFTGCGTVFHQKETDGKVGIAAIETAIHGCIGWAKNKDLKLLYGIIADDSTYLEVDPGKEIISGIQQFKKNEAFWMHQGFKAVRYDIRDLKINVSRSGDVAWFYCLLDGVRKQSIQLFENLEGIFNALDGTLYIKKAGGFPVWRQLYHVGYLHCCLKIETGNAPEYIGLYKTQAEK